MFLCPCGQGSLCPCAPRQSLVGTMGLGVTLLGVGSCADPTCWCATPKASAAVLSWGTKLSLAPESGPCLQEVISEPWAEAGVARNLLSLFFSVPSLGKLLEPGEAQDLLSLPLPKW